MNFHRPSPPSGFSIVEVVLALGIAAFALVSVVGLLPLGLGMAGETGDESGAVNLTSAVVSDRLVTSSTAASSIYNLPAMPSSATATLSGTFGAKENGEYTADDLTHARYRVIYLLTPPASEHSGPWTAWFKVTWPALAPKNASSFETVVTFPQP